jgi:hypothetical protein
MSTFENLIDAILQLFKSTSRELTGNEMIQCFSIIKQILSRNDFKNMEAADTQLVHFRNTSDIITSIVRVLNKLSNSSDYDLIVKEGMDIITLLKSCMSSSLSEQYNSDFFQSLFQALCCVLHKSSYDNHYSLINVIMDNSELAISFQNVLNNYCNTTSSTTTTSTTTTTTSTTSTTTGNPYQLLFQTLKRNDINEDTVVLGSQVLLKVIINNDSNNNINMVEIVLPLIMIMIRNCLDIITYPRHRDAILLLAIESLSKLLDDSNNLSEAVKMLFNRNELCEMIMSVITLALTEQSSKPSPQSINTNKFDFQILQSLRRNSISIQNNITIDFNTISMYCTKSINGIIAINSITTPNSITYTDGHCKNRGYPA